MVVSGRGRCAPEPAVRPARRPRLPVASASSCASPARPTTRSSSMGLEALRNMDHRGATGSDPETGDGAGSCCSCPTRFLRRGRARSSTSSCRRRATTPSAMASCRAIRRCSCAARSCSCASRRGGPPPLGWRDVPVQRGRRRASRASREPVVRQLFVDPRRGVGADAFRRKLYVIRRRVELALGARASVGESTSRSPASRTRRSSTRACYRARSSAATTPTCRTRFASAIALVHSRFSTNTLGTWDLAHPFNFLATTARSTRAWQPRLAARARAAAALGAVRRRPAKLFPIIDERWSDSATLDAALELLVLGGRTLRARAGDADPGGLAEPRRDAGRRSRAFYEYHAALLEPWDGPAAIAFTDGRQVGADARPQRPAAGALRADARRPASCSPRRSACSTSTRPT